MSPQYPYFINQMKEAPRGSLSLITPRSGRRGNRRPHGNRGAIDRARTEAWTRRAMMHLSRRDLYKLTALGAAPVALAACGEASNLDTEGGEGGDQRDRKSTRLNSSHVAISYAVFCLKQKRTQLMP